MAKKKKNLSEFKNKKDTVKRVNPFEIHVNKKKFNVLGRDLKSDRGVPGVARTKALKKRKETLLHEYKNRDKSNKFVDRRIHVKSSGNSQNSAIARFSAEKIKSHKKELFNLADDDEALTYMGRSIADIENFDLPSDDEDDMNNGDAKGLDANFVGEANFGGGNNVNRRATIIEELIAKSKTMKAEKKMLKDKTMKKTEELDAAWKELMPFINMGNNEPKETVEKKDPYDRMLNDLKFEPRGNVGDKLKSESEIAEEEARKLKELEEERLRRMRGDDPTTQQKTLHRSADDLDDGFELEEDVFELKYDKDGNPIGLDKLKGEKMQMGFERTGEGDSGSEDEDDSDDEEEEDSDGDEHDPEQDVENPENESNSNKQQTSDETKEEEGEGNDSDSDDLSDLKVENDEEIEMSDDEMKSEIVKEEAFKKNVEETSDVSETILTKQSVIQDTTEDGAVSPKIEKQIKEKKKVTFSENLQQVSCISEPGSSKETPEELQKKKEERERQMIIARGELPYAFEVPTKYEEMQELLKNRSVEHQAVIVERMIKCNHPSLNEKNKEKLENLFAFLIQHLNDADYNESWSILDRLAPSLFDLTQFSPNNAAYCLSESISEKHSDYIKKKYKYPKPETLLFLKLVPLLFPTSDKRHPVTTPAFVFISGMLYQCRVTTKRGITSGLFLVSLITEYVSISKRVMPEALNFLCGIIYMASTAMNFDIPPPFKREHKFLFLNESYSDRKEDIDLKMQVSDLSPDASKVDDIYKIKFFYCALKLLESFIGIYKDIPGCRLMFERVKRYLDVVEISKYPEIVRVTYIQICAIISDLCETKLNPIVMEAKKPKALKLYEPAIKPVSVSRFNSKDVKGKHQKMLHDYRQEMKGALREIRRDREFLAKLKFQEQAASDAERKRKVREIYSWGAQQQSEFKKLKRKK